MRSVVLALSSCGGLGYVPIAPGTFGTLAALPLWWWWSRFSDTRFIVVVVAFTLFSIGISHAAERYYGSHDVQHIVIDEVAGFLATVIAVPLTWGTALTAFVVFRILDATKPPPIRWFDKHVGGGFGVVIDDVIAGLLGCLLIHGVHLLLGRWW